MYNNNSEASKLDFKSRNEIVVIHLHNHQPSDLIPSLRFRKELSLKLVMFACNIYSCRSF